ncbi:MAG: hypothetical protein Q7R68_10965 [Nitrospirales bacterium]|nr:hypothetical protein [Nitrospirales bacterium]
MTTTATKDEEPIVEDAAEETVYTPEERAAFASGFEGKKTAPEDVVKTEEATAELPAKAEEVLPAKLVELTEEKYQELLKTATTVQELAVAVEQFKGNAFGKMGGLERTIKGLQEGNTSGKPMELSPEDLAELRMEYPEMTIGLEKGLTRILGKIKTGGPAFDPASVEPLIQAAIDKAKPAWKEELRREDATEALRERHPTWETIIGQGADTDFRKWLKGTKTPEEQTRILDTWNPKAAGDVIDEFLEHQKKTAAPPKTSDAEGRRSRMEQGVQPRGSTPPVPKSSTVEDAFREGFKTGRS